MSTAIDPRIANRRRAVAEHGARRGLRKMLGLLALCGLMGSAVWFVQSSALDIDIVAVHGAVRSDPGAVLAQNGVGEDTPVWLAQWRASDIEESLKAQPWVKDAVVKVSIPDTIEIEVLEYEGAAWVQGAMAWSLVASDGAVLSISASPDSVLPRVDLVVDAVVGAMIEDTNVLGAVEFAQALGPGHATEVAERDGALWAFVDGVDVKLGRAEAMADKGRALAALLESGIEQGAEVNLVAPTRPALVPAIEAEIEEP